MLVGSGKISEMPIDGNREVNSIAPSPEGRELVFGCGKQFLFCEWTPGRLPPFTTTEDEVFSVAYSPDGTRIVFGDRRGTVTLAERATGPVLWKEPGVQ